MSTPIALWLAEKLEDPESSHGYRLVTNNAADELRRLHQFELAFTKYLEKTEWVQETAKPHELGMDRADVLKQRIDRLHDVNQMLLDALNLITFECGNLHHASKDRHGFEPCPVEARIYAAFRGSR